MSVLSYIEAIYSLIIISDVLLRARFLFTENGIDNG
jgi:hypothetical protein